MSGKKDPRTSDQERFERCVKYDSVPMREEERLSLAETRNLNIVNKACTIWLKKRGLL